jgi:hypothetical protein
MVAGLLDEGNTLFELDEKIELVTVNDVLTVAHCVVVRLPLPLIDAVNVIPFVNDSPGEVVCVESTLRLLKMLGDAYVEPLISEVCECEKVCKDVSLAFSLTPIIEAVPLCEIKRTVGDVERVPAPRVADAKGDTVLVGEPE